MKELTLHYPILHFALRWMKLLGLAILIIVGTGTLAFFMDPWLRSLHLQEKIQTFIQPLRTLPAITQLDAGKNDSEFDQRQLIAAMQEIRTENNLKPLQENATLQKIARLLTLEVEDNQTLSVADQARTSLSLLSSAQPKLLESSTVFFPKYAEVDLPSLAASTSSILNGQLREYGIATRSGTFQDQKGIILVMLFSSTFSGGAVQPATQQSTSRPTFTGQDLWQAVQNYRRAHALFAFEQSNELCTVASIRVNELLELGKLDNHDGFKPRADQFFEKNPGWTSINENIAAGYQTAVQTVEWGWDQSLGHQALIQSKEYPKACAAANSGFAVLITGK